MSDLLELTVGWLHCMCVAAVVTAEVGLIAASWLALCEWSLVLHASMLHMHMHAVALHPATVMRIRPRDACTRAGSGGTYGCCWL